ncbi:MAG: indolepyruvate ferredoxin oxidoreductase subunit alpha [Ignavibacteriales bacterium]
MPKVIFNEERCKGCKLCIQFCPKSLLEVDKNTINTKGFYAIKITDQGKCTGCASCAVMCPDVAIEIEK